MLFLCVCFCLQKELGSRVGVVQYSHDGTQELVSMEDPKITTVAQLKRSDQIRIKSPKYSSYLISVD